MRKIYFAAYIKDVLDEDEAACLYVQLLGVPGVRSGESWHSLVPDQRFQLLAYLAFCGDWVSRERAAFLFWPDADTQRAKRNLRTLLFRVRALEWPKLEADAYRVRWTVATDVAAFRQALSASRLDEALSRYSGSLLKDMEGDEAPEFSEWLALERGHLHASWREAVLRRAEALAQTGRNAEAAQLLSGLLVEDEFDEEALQSYVVALARAGRPREALRNYKVFAKRLQDEFGIEPTSATQQLVEATRNATALKAATPKPLPKPPDAAPPEKPAKVGPGRLPTSATSFVGRDLELAEVGALLARPDCRLLTLSGPGGVGKTRVALQVAHELRRVYRDGAYFVPLDALSSPESIPSSLASALELSLQGSEPPLAQIVRYLEDKYVLLVLDNFEHLLSGAVLASELLQGCPGLKLLTTSRERLNLEEEWVFPLEGLSYPEGDASLEDASEYEAVRLFVARARRVSPSLSLTETELPHVLRICRLVEGLPLGLELAAVWVRAMPASEIAGELETNLDLLSTESRNVLERHRSVRAAFEGSWNLLSPTEQEVLRKLSVFRGGFRKEAAAYVADASIAILAALVDKSLLRLAATGRYDRHLLLFQYMHKKLVEDEREHEETQKRHVAYFLSLAEEAETYRQSSEHTMWVGRLEAEQANFQASLQWLKKRNESELKLRLTGALSWFWWQCGYLNEGSAWLQAALTGGLRETAARAKALNGAGLIAWSQSLYSSARILQEENLAIRRALGDESGTAVALNNLGIVAHDERDYAGARSLHEQSWAIWQKLGNKRGVAWSLTNLGLAAHSMGDHPSARALHEESLALMRELGNESGVALSLINLGIVVCDQGDCTLARSLHKESLELFWKQRNQRGVAFSLEGFASLAVAQGEVSRAVHLWGASEAVREAIGAPLPPSGRDSYERDLKIAQNLLDGPLFNAAWAEGRAMSIEQAIAYALVEA